MDRINSQHLLQVMVDYFDAGNKETDATAKAILESDFDHKEQWNAEIIRIKKGKDWTGIRAPEAEIVAVTLRQIQQIFTDRS